MLLDLIFSLWVTFYGHFGEISIFYFQVLKHLFALPNGRDSSIADIVGLLSVTSLFMTSVPENTCGLLRSLSCSTPVTAQARHLDIYRSANIQLGQKVSLFPIFWIPLHFGLFGKKADRTRYSYKCHSKTSIINLQPSPTKASYGRKKVVKGPPGLPLSKSPRMCLRTLFRI